MTLCRHIGHTIKIFDSGYGICNRCGSHEYYQTEEWQQGWHSPAYRLYARAWELCERIRHWWAYRHTQRCSECRKVLVWRGFRLRYHEHDLPF